ncbi:hypothetical protein GCM10027597_19860 [Saccharopolyspora tripterygii]
MRWYISTGTSPSSLAPTEAGSGGGGGAGGGAGAAGGGGTGAAGALHAAAANNIASAAARTVVLKGNIGTNGIDPVPIPGYSNWPIDLDRSDCDSGFPAAVLVGTQLSSKEIRAPREFA